MWWCVSLLGFQYHLSCFGLQQFPYGTLIVNISGCFLMGLLFVLTTERWIESDPSLRALLLIGLLGGYTTFSSFSIETLMLYESGHWLGALLNVVLSVSLCSCCYRIRHHWRTKLMNTTNVIMVRIYITESSQLLHTIVTYLKKEANIQGVSVFRAISGFGETGERSSSLLS